MRTAAVKSLRRHGSAQGLLANGLGLALPPFAAFLPIVAFLTAVWSAEALAKEEATAKEVAKFGAPSR
jgi:hypothetical protein